MSAATASANNVPAPKSKGAGAPEAAQDTAVPLEDFTPSKLPAGSDPILTKINMAKKTVNKSDSCTFNPEYAKKLPILVQWKQWMMDKEDTYYVIGFKNNTMSLSTPSGTGLVVSEKIPNNCTADNPTGYLFVAQDHLEKFIKDSPAGEFKVTENFHYGQAKKTGEGRFLVLHDPKLHTIHQYRFISGYWSWVDKASKKIGDSSDAPKQIQTLAGLLPSVGTIFGDDLHTFDEAAPVKT